MVSAALILSWTDSCLSRSNSSSRERAAHELRRGRWTVLAIGVDDGFLSMVER
jgi:hypothetical protein